MKKILALILAVVCVFSLSACAYEKTEPTQQQMATEVQANEFFTEFFSSYQKMSEYVTRGDIALSSYTLINADLPSLLKATYQAKSVSYTFEVPQRVNDTTFKTLLTVEAPDMNMLYEAYLIDTLIDPEADVVNSFYSNINAGATSIVKTEGVELVAEFANGKWQIASNNALVYAIFPNINLINA